MLELADWRLEDIKIQASKVSNTPLLQHPPPPLTSPLPTHPPTTAATPSPPIPNLLSCDDCEGGCHPSESAQGQFTAPPTPVYTTADLYLVDTFHHVGSTALSRQLDKGLEGEYIFATQLAVIAETYGFNGWLMNIGASFPGEGFRPGKLQAFLRELRSAVVIWYDALTLLNLVHWQRALILHNAPSFGVNDGLFTNYELRGAPVRGYEDHGRLYESDCFGRESLSGGGFGVGENPPSIRSGGHLRCPSRPDGRISTVTARILKTFRAFSRKACAGSEFFFTNFSRGLGKGWWMDGVVCSTSRAHSPTPRLADIKCFVW
ncbi:glycosyl hydrolase family 85-domain-containing protein [Tuber brumale]|nr:glycosyl hydrolase family 85-domain-containing protein [Tuber brumale]